MTEKLEKTEKLVELTDAELDLVSGGRNTQSGTVTAYTSGADGSNVTAVSAFANGNSHHGKGSNAAYY